MYSDARNVQKNKNRSASSGFDQKNNSNESIFQFVDNRPEFITQRIIQQIANNSYQHINVAKFQAIANNHSRQQQKHIQKKADKKGMLCSQGKETSFLSGHSINVPKEQLNTILPSQIHSQPYVRGDFKYMGQSKKIIQRILQINDKAISESKITKKGSYKTKFNKVISAVARENGYEPHQIRSELVRIINDDALNENFSTKREACEYALYGASISRGKKNVAFAKKYSGEELAKKRPENNKPFESYLASDKIQNLKTRIESGKVTFNFNYAKAKQWSVPKMLNSFEVLEKFNIMSGNLENYVNTRDRVESRLFGLQKGSERNPEINEIKDEKEKALAVNKEIPPNMRPKYAALNYANYAQGSAPSQYYGMSHVEFNNSIKERCTITAGDSLGEEGGLADLAFPLTNDGIAGLIENSYRNVMGGAIWYAPNAEPGVINTEGENANNPDWNFLEVQVHGEVDYGKEADKIVIAKSELGEDAPEEAIQNMKEITNVNNITCI